MKSRKFILKLIFVGLLFLLISTVHGLPGFVNARTLRMTLASSSMQLPEEELRQRPTIPPPRPTLTPAPQATSTPVPQPPDQDSSDPAQLCLRLTSEPDSTTAPADVVTYNVGASHIGGDRANGVEITLPLAPDAQELQDVTFTSPVAWVSDVMTNAVEMRMETLEENETITGTLRLRIHPEASLGSTLTTRAQMNWRGESLFSNRVSLAIADVPADSGTVPLNIVPNTGSSATAFVVSYDGFSSYEQVGLWYDQPDGSTVAFDSKQADAQGLLTFDLLANGLVSGDYRLVAYGQCSQVAAVGIFAITAE